MYFTQPKLEKNFKEADLVIFDMNGLIIDDENIQLKAFNQVLKSHNLQIKEYFGISECVGHKEPEIFLKIFSLSNIKISVTKLKKLVAKKNRAYEKLIVPIVKIIVRKGVLEFINHIKKQTKKSLALATSTTRQGCQSVLGLQGLNIINEFDLIVSGQEVKKAKPDPAIYFKIKKHFNLLANKCLVLEDSSPGVIAAKNANMICFAIPSKYTINQDFSRADFVISSLSRKAKIIL